MLLVDSFSRYPICMVVQSELLAKLTAPQKSDTEIQAIAPDGNEYTFYGRLLYRVCDGWNSLEVPKGMQIEIIICIM